MAAENIAENDVYAENAGKDSGLDVNVAGAVAYVLGFLTGIVMFVIDDRPEVRFHAAQSMLLSAAIFAVYFVFSLVTSVLFATLFTGSFFLVGTISGLVALVFGIFGLASFVLWVYMIYSAYSGKQVELPVVGKMARNIASN